MSEKLKPCPFCGGEAELIQHHERDNEYYSYFVHCKKCVIRTTYLQSAKKVIAAWNTRTEAQS